MLKERPPVRFLNRGLAIYIYILYNRFVDKKITKFLSTPFVLIAIFDVVLG